MRHFHSLLNALHRITDLEKSSRVLNLDPKIPYLPNFGLDKNFAYKMGSITFMLTHFLTWSHLYPLKTEKLWFSDVFWGV